MESSLDGIVSTIFNNTTYAQTFQKVANGWRLDLPRSGGFISSHISDRPVTIRIYANITKVSRQAVLQGSGTRGKISNFSGASRKRMLEYLAMIRNMSKVVFITLTYPALYANKAERWKRDLATFLKRLYRLSAKCFGIWRIEPQRRGAPHFHLLLSGHPSTLLRFRKWVKMAWFDVVNSGDNKHYYAGTQVDKVYSRKHAMYYVSKYAAKKERTTYKFLTTDGEIINSIGKHWGIHNRAAADVSEYLELSLSPKEFVQLRRLVSTWLTKRGSFYGRRIKRMHPKVGFAVFGLGDSSDEGKHRIIMRMLISIFDEEFTWQSLSSV